MQPAPMSRPAPVQAPGFQAAPARPDPAEARARMAQNPMVQASVTLKEGIDKLVAFLNQKEVPNKLQVAAFLDKEIAPYFDFDYMARWVAGPAYGRMSGAEKKAMAARLEEGFLTALGGQLATYDGQQVRLLRPRKGARGSVSVNVGILRPGSYPAKMEFRMYKGPEGWKVYDVVANSRSAASYYRTRFQRMGAPAPR
jgi:phospholipid transport system substrate-binding protein